MSESGYRSRSSSASVERHVSFWRGLPAGILAILGLGAIVFAADRSSKLEQRYQRWAEDSSRKREELAQDLDSELRMRMAGQSNKTIDELIPPDDNRRVKLEELWASERLFYEKLIGLNSAKPEYRYQFALACLNSKSQGDVQRGLSLLQSLAPLDQPGYFKAHLWWIERIKQMMQLRQISPKQAAEMVYVHADHCLKRQSTEKVALINKAEAAFALGRNEDALEAYSGLFEEDPFFFGSLVKLYSRMNRSEMIPEVYRNAKTRFESRLLDDMSGDKWMQHWEALLNCMLGLEEHELAVTRLRDEINRQKEIKNSHYQDYLEKMLAKVLVANLRRGNPDSRKFTVSDVELMKEAFQLDAKNPDVLQTLTHIAMAEDSDLSEAARQIYDPTKDEAPSHGVLNEMGTVALGKKDYEQAADYLERALKLDPRNAQTLNNLAYVYLVGSNRDPERSLKLVDEAIRGLKNPDNLTHFLDTRATALMQLGRLPEAIATFELALKDRPDNVKIIESLIECYEASNLSAEAYKERLKRLTENQSADAPGDAK